MYQYLSYQQQQVRKRVFFRPQLSTQIKHSQYIHPQFINDTQLMYLSSYDFISYDIQQQSFKLIHRPLSKQLKKIQTSLDWDGNQNQNKLKNNNNNTTNNNNINNINNNNKLQKKSIYNNKCSMKSMKKFNIQNILDKQQIINIYFDKDKLNYNNVSAYGGNDVSNDVYYVTKTIYQQQQVYFLQRRLNSINYEYHRRIIAKGKSYAKTNITLQDLIMLQQNKNKNNKNKIKQQSDLNIVQNVVQFQKDFLVKSKQNLVIFVIKKQKKILQKEKKKQLQKQPQIKINKNYEQQDTQLLYDDQYEYQYGNQQDFIQNESQGQSAIEKFKMKSIKQQQNLQKKEQTQKSLKQKQNNFQENQKKPSHQTQQKYKNVLLIHSCKDFSSITYQLQQSIEYIFNINHIKQTSLIGCVTQKFFYLLKIQINNRNFYGLSSYNQLFDMVNTKSRNSSSNLKNNNNNNQGNKKSVNNVNIEIIEKVSIEFYMKNQQSIQQPQYDFMKKKRDNKYSVILNKSLAKDRRISDILQSERKDIQQKYVDVNKKGIKNHFDIFQSIKVIKKVVKSVPVFIGQKQFIAIIYSISRVICQHQSLQTLTCTYQIKIYQINSDLSMSQLQFQRINGSNIQINLLTLDIGRKDISTYKQYSQQNILQMIIQCGGIESNKNLILIWQKNQSTIHQLILKIDTRVSQMNDISQPGNLKTANMLDLPYNYVLQYRNRININLNNLALIKQIQISPSNNNFLILTYKAPKCKDKLQQIADTFKDLIQCQQPNDIQNYLIFQYDLFTELWSNDPNIYIKPIKNYYKNRKVENIVPYLMKDQILILTGKTIHQINKQILEGILVFDLHPYGYFLAVSFGFNAKIYSMQHSTINLIYTYNSQNIKKIKYSPNGSDIVIMSQKSIKILDSYSFAIKYILNQKYTQYSFSNFYFSSLGNHFYTVQDNNHINVYDTIGYQKIDIIKPYYKKATTYKNVVNINIHQKVISFLSSQLQQFCLALFENGQLYMKYAKDKVPINQQMTYQYQDNIKITAIHYNQQKKVLFCGLENGWVRCHIWPIMNDLVYTFQNYSEFKYGYYQISVITTSHLTNTMYIGDVNGNVAVSKYIIDNQKKISGQPRMESYYINLPMTNAVSNINSSKNPFQAFQKCYKYVLSSSTISLNQTPQKLKLQYKLNQILTRMNQQMLKYKSNMCSKLQHKQQIARSKVNFSKLYQMNQLRMAQIQQKTRECQEKYQNEKFQEQQYYEKTMEEIIQQQNNLTKQRGLKLSINFIGRAFLRKRQMMEYQQLLRENQKVFGKDKDSKNNQLNLIMRQQQLVPYNQIDNLPNHEIHVRQEYLQKLDKQLIQYQQKNYFLKSANTYLQNNINKIQISQLKHQNITFKINNELVQMSDRLNYQQKLMKNLGGQIVQAQQNINKNQQNYIQNKKKTTFTKKIQGSITNDQCEYRIWVKDRFNQEVEMLCQHWINLGDIMEQKQNDMVEIIGWNKKFTESIQSMKLKRQNLKKYLHFLIDNLMTIKNKTKQVKNNSLNHQFIKENQQVKAQKKALLNKVKSINFIKKQYKASLQKMEGQSKGLIMNQIHKQSIQKTIQGNQYLLKSSLSKNKSNVGLNISIKSPDHSKNTSKKFISDEIKQKIDVIVEKIQNKVRNDPNQFYEKIERKKKKKNNRSLEKSIIRLNTHKKINLQNQKQKQIQVKKQQNNNYVDNQINSFSATSSPIIKTVITKTKLYDKGTNFLKNFTKFHQRKVNKLNKEEGYLLGQFELLRFQNKRLFDKQQGLKQNIDVINHLSMTKSHSRNFTLIDDNSLNRKNQDSKRTPFQRYIQHKANQQLRIKNMKINQSKEELKTMNTTTANTTRMKFYATAASSPRNTDQSFFIKTQRTSIKKKYFNY